MGCLIGKTTGWIIEPRQHADPLQAKLPSSCSSGSANGPCSSATNTAWPGTGTSPPTTTTSSGPCTTPTLTAVTFNEVKTTNYGDTVYIVGSISQLGSWNTDNAVALSASGYTSSNPVWTGKISFPVGTSFQYKYFVKTSSGTVTWESGSNRAYAVAGNCAGTATENDTWM